MHREALQTAFKKVILPPNEIILPFQFCNLLVILSTRKPQPEQFILQSNSGKPKYFKGKDPTEHINSAANSAPSSVFIGSSYVFCKLIIIPDIASKDIIAHYAFMTEWNYN